MVDYSLVRERFTPWRSGRIPDIFFPPARGFIQESRNRLIHVHQDALHLVK